MKPCQKIVGNESGSVLIIAIFMLFMVTMLGFFSTNTSTIETKISANNAFYKKALYVAESGLEHARLDLTKRFGEDSGNLQRLASDVVPVWTFALKNNTLATGEEGDDATDATFDGGAIWFNNVALGDCQYEVRVYDDYDDGMPGDASFKPDEDANGRVYVRSVATCYPGNRAARTEAAVEMILAGRMQEQAVTDYNAQSGAGAGKVSEGGDKDAIVDAVLSGANPIAGTI